MKILRLNQYNQGIGKYKLLTSTAGVGSIITTKVGYYILISDINKWKFVQKANRLIGLIREKDSDILKIYKDSKIDIERRGLAFIDDKRFVDFLKREKGLPNLVCLVSIPNMSLNESFNTPNWNNHPIKTALINLGEDPKGAVNEYMILGTHFPKWFKNKNGDLKKINEWFKIWQDECKRHGGQLRLEHFAPPRDGNDFMGEINSKNEDGTPIKIREYKPLEQTNLTLICPNGHLSDLPWSKYLKWKTEKELRIRHENDNGEDLFYCDDCCTTPKLKWTESKTKSEGYASIFIECKSCDYGSGKDDKHPKINLEGINNLKPHCPGEKPWEIELVDILNVQIPNEQCFKKGDVPQGRELMQPALVTGNNVYFASCFSSLFIPLHLAENKSRELIDGLKLLNEKYQRYYDRINISKEEFWNEKFQPDGFIIENGFDIKDEDLFVSQLKNEFLKIQTTQDEVDHYENYRWNEYRCFVNTSSVPDLPENFGLKFNNINIHEEIIEYFSKILQVEELKVTQVQLDFTRVRPNERIIRNGNVQISTDGKNIFSIDSKELFVLPANETLGEGLFFQFNNEKIDTWIKENKSKLMSRFKRYIENEPDLLSQGASFKQKIYNNQYKHFLIHTFSHIIMRELEFSCGYPTASLKERLYISNNLYKLMSGVLIYTAEGSEGSMGGLVSQGEPNKILDIIKSGLSKSVNCSSDPLCWESEGQGIFDLNLSSCFSCSLISETACEEMNLGLDRRVIIDEKFGYFNKLTF